MKRPQPDEFIPFQQKYIDAAGENVFAELENQVTDFSAFLQAIPASKHNFAYAEGKWTIKELVGHVIDTERIMAYRMLRFARKDATPLAGFEEDEYVSNAHFSNQDFNLMVEEFALLRKANLFLFKSLTEEEINRRGVASGNVVSVRALLFILAGHVNHHRKVMVERYL